MSRSFKHVTSLLYADALEVGIEYGDGRSVEEAFQSVDEHLEGHGLSLT